MAETMTPSLANIAQGTWFHARLPQIVPLMAASGFGLTFVELVLIGHHEKAQVVALGVCGFGLLLSLLGLVVQGIWRKIVVGLLILVALEGFVGTAMHRFGDPTKNAGEATMAAAQPATGNAPDHDHHAPPLAPLSITGFAVLASVAIAARKRA